MLSKKRGHTSRLRQTPTSKLSVAWVMAAPFTKTLIVLTVLDLLPCPAFWDTPGEWKMTYSTKFYSYLTAANEWPSFGRVLTTFKTVDHDLPVSVAGNLRALYSCKIVSALFNTGHSSVLWEYTILPVRCRCAVKSHTALLSDTCCSESTIYTFSNYFHSMA